MLRPKGMDDVVTIMVQARNEHRRLNHDEVQRLDSLLHHLFHDS